MIYVYVCFPYPLCSRALIHYYNCYYVQGQAVAQLCSTVPNVTVFGIASCFKHAAIRDSVAHLFDRNVDYIQEVKK